MAFLAELWLPIVLSGVFVFVVSSICHVALPIHAGDFRKLPNEDAIRDALRQHRLTPGDYGVPWGDSMKEMCTDEMKRKFEEGPVAWMTVLPNGLPRMGRSLLLWFLFTLLVSVFVAYVVDLTVPAGARASVVFRLAGTVAVVGYAFSYVPDSIWKGRPWRTMAKFVAEGVVYGLVTGGTFGWLWPGA